MRSWRRPIGSRPPSWPASRPPKASPTSSRRPWRSARAPGAPVNRLQPHPFFRLAAAIVAGHICSMLKRGLIVALLALALAAPAQAQDEPPFDNDLQRLSEILGSLHYLRGICGANEGLKWRNEMQALIDAEAPGGDRRARMIAAFNRGYRGFQQTYRTCTPAADLVIRRYLEEGSKIAREMTARYAN